MNEDMRFIWAYAGKWLKTLIYVALAGILNVLISLIPVVPEVLTFWFSRGIAAVSIFCMYQLMPLNQHYKKAAVYRFITLAGTLVTAFLFDSSVLTLVASVFSILAVYEEYCAHAALIQKKDPKLAGKWHSLFCWGLGAGLLITFGTMAAAVLVAAMDMAAADATPVILLILSIPQFILDVVYLRYLQKMAVLLWEKPDAPPADLQEI